MTACMCVRVSDKNTTNSYASEQWNLEMAKGERILRYTEYT